MRYDKSILILMMLVLILFSISAYAYDDSILRYLEHGQTLGSSGGYNHWYGASILTRAPFTVRNISVDSTYNGDRCVVSNSSSNMYANSILESTTRVGNDFVFSTPVTLTNNTVYYIMCKRDSLSSTVGKHGDVMPVNTEYVNWVAGWYDGDDNDATILDSWATILGNIQKIGIGAEAVAPTPQISMLFSNSTYQTNKTTFNEGEDFFTYVNYTLSNGTVVSDSLGSCNISLYDGIEEVKSLNSNFTICNSGCSYSTYAETFTNTDTQNAKMDYVYFKSCSPQSASGDMLANISCGANSYSRTIQSTEIPICANGYGNIAINTSLCTGLQSFNFTLININAFSQRKIIYQLAYDREYTIALNSYPLEVIFNATTNLWVTKEEHEYYIHGTKYIDGNCSYNGDPSLNTNITKTLNIVNAKPEIFYNSVITALGETLLTPNAVIEYANSNYSFYIAVIDDDTVNFSVRLFNRSNSLIAISHNKPITDINAGNFTDFLTQNPYTLNVSAIDSAGYNNNATLSFNITDTANPVLSGFESTTILNGSVYIWNGQATDEYLWNFSISCSNGHAYAVFGIGATSFLYKNTSTISENTTCAIQTCDGHTANIMPDIPITKDFENKRLIFDDYSIYFTESKALSWAKKIDRYSFCTVVDKTVTTLSITMPNECIKAENSAYKGHYVCGNYAVDFEGNYPVITAGQDVFIDVSKATIDTKTAEKEICFNSIVALNCVSAIQDINVTFPFNVYDNTIIADTEWFNTEALNTDTTQGALFWFFTFFIIVGLVVLSEALKIPAIAIITGLLSVFYGLLLYTKISAVIGVIYVIISIMYIMRGIIMVNE